MARPIVPVGDSALTPRRRPGSTVAAIARTALAELQSDHAAAGLLGAIVVRLAEDVDSATDARDRVAATRGILEVLRELDTAVPPPKAQPVIAPADGADGAGGADAGDVDDPFGIGAGPAAAPVGDTAAS